MQRLEMALGMVIAALCSFVFAMFWVSAAVRAGSTLAWGAMLYLSILLSLQIASFLICRALPAEPDGSIRVRFVAYSAFEVLLILVCIPAAVGI